VRDLANKLLQGMAEVCCAADGCMATDDLAKCDYCGQEFCADHLDEQSPIEAICQDCREANEEDTSPDGQRIAEEIRAINREAAATRGW
jgi:hypothetical protein